MLHKPVGQSPDLHPWEDAVGWLEESRSHQRGHILSLTTPPLHIAVRVGILSLCLPPPPPLALFLFLSIRVVMLVRCSLCVYTLLLLSGIFFFFSLRITVHVVDSDTTVCWARSMCALPYETEGERERRVGEREKDRRLMTEEPPPT